MKIIYSVILFCLFSVIGRGQTTTRAIQSPDCIIPFQYTAVHSSTALDNRQIGCVNWSIVYSSTGFSAITLALQSAPDSSGVPGSWVTYLNQTVSVGINPNTATTKAQTTLTGFNPFVRMSLTAKTGVGTVTGVALGWRDTAASIGGGGSGGGGCDAPCVVIGPDAIGGAPTEPPVFVSARDGSGNIIPLQACTNSVAYDTSSSGLTQLVGLTSTQLIRICHWSGTPASAIDVKLVRGTGSNCGTGTADLSGLTQQTLAFAFDFGPDSPLIAAASNAVCISLSGAVRTTGTVTYAKY